MVSRPVYVIDDRKYVRIYNPEFEYAKGFAKSQKQKCIKNLHASFLRIHPEAKILDISRYSDNELGEKLSAFNLTLKNANGQEVLVELAFQSGKIFSNGGPYLDILQMDPGEAKKDLRLQNSGEIIGFTFDNEKFPTKPTKLFYTWLYLHALNDHPELGNELMHYNAFTDIVFNPNKSINCQAHAAAVYVSLRKKGELERALENQEFLAAVLSGRKHNTDTCNKAVVNIENEVIPPERAFDIEIVEFLRKCALEGILQELDYITPITERLKYVLNASQISVTEPTDDVLIEIVAKFIKPEEYPDLYSTMIEIVFTHCKSFALQNIKNKLVAAQDWEDYLSILKLVIVSKMQNYDASRGKPITFLRPYIMDEFYKARNEGTKYTASITKMALSAKNKLLAEGVEQPDNNSIADRINKDMKPSRPVSPTQVKNALELLFQNVEIDENIETSDDSYNPEIHYIDTVYKELLDSFGDKEHWAIAALFDVFKEYYYSDNPEELISYYKSESSAINEDINDVAENNVSLGKKNQPKSDHKGFLPIEYLCAAMREKTGQEFSPDSINNLIKSLQEALATRGIGDDILERRHRPYRKIISEGVFDTTQTDIEDEHGYEMIGGVRIYDLTNEIVTYNMLRSHFDKTGDN